MLFRSTVEDGLPASHAKRGWESLSDAILREVAHNAAACVYMLWGGHAQSKAGLIETATSQKAPDFLGLRNPSDRREALVLEANHPSPLSALRPPAPFIGCGHFSMARDWLAARGLDLDWSL